MKAILTYTTMTDGKAEEKNEAFRYSEGEKNLRCKNAFNYKVQEIYITEKGVVFFRNMNEDTLEIPNQKEVKKWIGANKPEQYIKFFGKVEEG